MNNLIASEFGHLYKNTATQKLLQNPLLDKDIWDIEVDLGLEVAQHKTLRNFSFKCLSQTWLKLLAKFYILSKAHTYSSGTLAKYLDSLKLFSKFLKKFNIKSYKQIDNQVFNEFDYYLHSSPKSEDTIGGYYSDLSSFFDSCRVEGWLDINTYWFKGKRIRTSQPKNDEINYIPQEVWNQLQENLHLLPEQIQRMVMIIRATGLRIGELLNLPLDCLRNRNNQWRLRFKTEKYKIEDELPLNSIELVAIIQEQRNYIIKLFGNSYKNLFCSSRRRKTHDFTEFGTPIPKVMYLGTFNKWLNKLSEKANICSKNGELWHFKSHQFRKTVATVMTNAGVRDLIIQKYLRHRSPDMQNYYKHLLKQVLGSEYQKLIQEKKYVDITGEVVHSHKPKNPITEMLRRRMYQITTQYGECHRPTLKKPCPTVNACWKCSQWRVCSDDLPYLKEDLERVENELKTAKDFGMSRQQQGLEDDRNALNNYIKGLELIG